MSDNIFDNLIEIFCRFPGIGPRQARRFVYHLLRGGKPEIERLINNLRRIGESTSQCNLCFQYFSRSTNHEAVVRCDLCRSDERDRGILMVVEKDADLETIKQSGVFSGLFFVLGGLVPILEKNPQMRIRLNELKKRIAFGKSNGLKEIILALPVNTEGDHTVEILQANLESAGLKVSILGRGLSTGTELEYSDTETIKNALRNRS